LVVAKHNMAMEMMGMAMGKDSVDDLLLPEVEYDDINLLFQQWADFRARPDFRDHMRSWFMGADLSKLPAPPDPPKEEEKEGVENVRDPGLSISEGEEEGSSGSPPDDVPEVRSEDHS